jgi:hypothetical protein
MVAMPQRMPVPLCRRHLEVTHKFLGRVIDAGGNLDCADGKGPVR